VVASGGSTGTASGTGGTTTPGSGGAQSVPASTGGAPSGTGGAPAASSGGAGPTGSSGGVGGKPGAAGGSTTAGSGGSAPPAGGGATGTLPSGTDPGTDGDGDFTIMPPYAGTVQVTNVPHSTKYQFQFDNSTSKVYPATGTRPITVYIPKQYVDGTSAPFIIITDGNAPATGSPEIVTAAENHYEDTDPTTKIPPLVFVFVPPGSNRSGEYDTVSDAFSRFITGEILPLVSSNADIKAAYPGFKLTTDPNGRAAYGCSSGSPAAMGLGWFSTFNRIVSYSGTFVALQMTADHPLGAWEYPAMILAQMPPKPLRIFLEVGQMDNGYMTDAAMHRNWVVGNQNMAAALKMMGYHYRFLYAMGAGHCDGSVKSKTYSQTLNWVWRGYVPAP
jgi:enterochelin esterase-like enzyme